MWQKRVDEYPWSSYQDFTKNDRWGKCLSKEIILNQFLNQKEYETFLKENTAKAPEYLKNNFV